ncbi:MAG: metalloregulator ArsR/SmtB family transcription factor [Woeseiaceae bacterium]
MNLSPESIIPALAEPHRRQIVELLASRGRMNATDISKRFDVTPAAVSQHLKVLRNAQILTMHRKAQQRLYEINPAAFEELEQWSRKMKETWTARFNQLDALLNEDW